MQRYLGAYPASVLDPVRRLVAEQRLGDYLARRYPERHAIQSDGALYDYVLELKQAHLRSSPPLHKVQWQNKMDVLQNVLGLHTAISRVQGAKLKAKKEIRIASLFKEAAPEFLEMVAVHELAHLRELDHNKAFYQLCRHMLPDYHQVEFDLRLWLLQRSLEAAAA
ncbi:MAG TPA: M48 family metallopeptidase [Solimonas sp.]|nr:M48 family metallopeptidase [Solimonas sp.]